MLNPYWHRLLLARLLRASARARSKSAAAALMLSLLPLLAPQAVGCAAPTTTGAERAAGDPDADAAQSETECLSWASLSFVDLMRLEPDRIDIGLGSGLLAYESGFATLDDVRAMLDELDLLAEQALRQRVVNIHMYDDLPPALKRQRDMQNARRLVEYIGELGFRFDRSDPDGHNPDNLFLHTVLKRRSGYCVSLTMLAAALGQRLRVPVNAVRVPGHMFLRHGGRGGSLDSSALNFEMTNGGVEHPSSYYLTRFRVHGTALANGVFLRSLDRREVFSDACSNLGSLLFLRGRYDEAIRWYEQAIACDPRNSQAYYNLGTTYARLERPVEAVEAFREAIERDAGDYLAYCGRGRLYIEAGDPAFGFEDLARAINLRPDEAHAYRLRGVLYAKAGDYEKAEPDLRRALELDGSDLGTARNLALVYLRSGELAEAVRLRSTLERLHDGGRETENLLHALELAAGSLTATQE